MVHWRIFGRAPAVLILFLLAQKSKYQSCYWFTDLVSWNLCHAFETVLEESKYCNARIDVPSWRSWTTFATSVASW